ncbi:UDP-N-acetylglucosamine 2-epimerase [Fulvimarina pelagi]|nr:UDP-N-acetylglucosamine 2-epimerase [Fulvimarina pelagi]
MSVTKRRIFVATTSRADFGIYQPVFKALASDPRIEASLLVSGDHVPLLEQGNDMRAARLARQSGLRLAGLIPMPLGSGNSVAIGAAMAQVTAGASEFFFAVRPDVLLVLGDRYEMHAVVVAASAHKVPVAHIHGGEESEGAVDNLYRHSLTKLSHLHFCATALSEQRILAMGEEPWRVFLTGAPSLDGIAETKILDRKALGIEVKLPDGPFLLATYHPETMRSDKTVDDLDEMIAALDEIAMPTLFSQANSDELGQEINRRLKLHSKRCPWMILHNSLGRHKYFSAMLHAAVMVGNSSSGIIEAASFSLPVINIGGRQKGRERSANVVDVPPERSAVIKAVRNAIEHGRLEVENVYGDGHASQKITKVLAEITVDSRLLIKRFNLNSV